jgi:uncharacterized protein YycO
MKLHTIIDTLDKSHPCNDINEGIFLECDLYYNWFNQDRLVYYWIKVWNCTDTSVGMRAYYLDNNLVAISSQRGRKDGETFEWVSEEAVRDVKNYLKLLLESIDVPFPHSIIDMDQEMGEGYHLEFPGQVLSHIHTVGMYNGNKVTIDSVSPKYRNNHYSVNIIMNNTTETSVNISDILFPYNTKR